TALTLKTRSNGGHLFAIDLRRIGLNGSGRRAILTNGNRFVGRGRVEVRATDGQGDVVCSRRLTSECVGTSLADWLSIDRPLVVHLLVRAPSRDGRIHSRYLSLTHFRCTCGETKREILL